MRAPGHAVLSVTAALAVLALAGCKQESAPEGPRTAEQVAAESAGLARPEPGLYRSTVELVSVDVPGMPPQALDQMKRAMAARAGGSEYCLSPDEAKKGYEERVKQLAGRPECSFDRFNAGSGTLDAQLTCKGEQGARSVLTMKGAMGPQGSDVTMSMDQTAAAGPGMKMTMHVTSKRVGECPSGAPATPGG